MPEAEAKHLPPKQRSKTPLLVLLALFLGCVGAGLWAVYDTAELPVVVARTEPESGPAAANAPAAGKPVAGNGAATAMTQANASATAQARMPANTEAPPSNAAAIIDDHPLAQLTQPAPAADEGEAANPLAALAVTAAAPKPAAVPRAAPSRAPGPAAQHAERSREATVVAAATPGAPASTSRARRRAARPRHAMTATRPCWRR
ncbi:hypothetical protein WJ972_08880 [Achromobacter insuavis]